MNQYHIYEKIGKGKYSTCYKGRRKVGVEGVTVYEHPQLYSVS